MVSFIWNMDGLIGSVWGRDDEESRFVNDGGFVTCMIIYSPYKSLS